MSAAAVRYVRRMGCDNRTFTAAILDLAVRGHLKLSEVDKKMSVEQRSDGKPIAPPELAAERALFHDGSPSLALEQDNHEVLEKARDALSDGLEKIYAGQLFHDHMGWSIVGACLVVAVIALTLLSAWAARGWDVFTAFATDMSFLIIGGLLLAYIVRWLYRAVIRGRVFSLLLHAIQVLFALLFGLGAIAAATEIVDVVPGWLQAAPVGMTLILFPLAVSAFYWMKAHTVAGRKIVDQIEGFRQYLGVAEEAWVEALHRHDTTTEM